MSKMFLPETNPELIDKSLKVNKEAIGVNVIDALATGAADGLKLALNIGGMLLAFIAIIFALNWILVYTANRCVIALSPAAPHPEEPFISFPSSSFRGHNRVAASAELNLSIALLRQSFNRSRTTESSGLPLTPPIPR
jgi:hypothetical protein